VLRLRNPDASAVERACIYAWTQLGKQYSKAEAYRSRKCYFAAELQLYLNLIEVTKRRVEAAHQVIAAGSASSGGDAQQ